MELAVMAVFVGTGWVAGTGLAVEVAAFAETGLAVAD
jgi:hypothetical protein